MRLEHSFNSANGTTQTFRLTNNVQKLVFIDKTPATDLLTALKGLKIKANITTPNQNDAVMISKQQILMPVLISSEIGTFNYEKNEAHRFEILLSPNGSLALNNDNAYIDIELTSSIASTKVDVYSDASPIVGKVFNTFNTHSLLSGSKTLNVSNIYALCLNSKHFTDMSLRYANGTVENKQNLFDFELQKQKSVSKLAFSLDDELPVYEEENILLPLIRDGVNISSVECDVINDTKYTSLQLTQYLS